MQLQKITERNFIIMKNENIGAEELYLAPEETENLEVITLSDDNKSKDFDEASSDNTSRKSKKPERLEEIIKKRGNNLKVLITDREFINSKDRAFPVIIDPHNRAKPCFIFHAPKVRFIEKSTCFRKCFFLCLKFKMTTFILTNHFQDFLFHNPL